MSTLMKCGCRAQGMEDGRPICPIHDAPLGTQPANARPNLKGRKAYCTYCNTSRPSSLDLPFFTLGVWSKGERDNTRDGFYCGCRGWD